MGRDLEWEIGGNKAIMVIASCFRLQFVYFPFTSSPTSARSQNLFRSQL